MAQVKRRPGDPTERTPEVDRRTLRRLLQGWPNDPADDGNGLAGVVYALLIEVGVVLVVLLLYRLF
jgi:hypothetical protein